MATVQRSVLTGRVSIVTIVTTLLATLTALAVPPPTTWPAAGDYRIVRCSNGHSWDPVKDAPGGLKDRDIVGDAAFPGMQYADDGSYLFFRLRVDDDPTVKGGNAPLSQFGWGVGIDTDGDPSGFEYMVTVNGITEVVRMTRLDTGGAVNLWTPTIGGWVTASLVTDGSAFNGNPDWWLTWSIPLNEVISMTASHPAPFHTGAFRIWVATSTNGVSLDKDFMCWDDSTQGSVDLSQAAALPIIAGTHVAVTGPSNGDLVATVTPEIVGDAEPDVTLQLSIGEHSAAVVADAEGGWSFDVPASWGLQIGDVVSVTAAILDDGTGHSAQDSVTFTLACPALFEPSPAKDGCVAIDSDEDGLPDNVEVLLGTEPDDADTDDDGVEDGVEVGIGDADPTTTTDPLDPDSDDDGLLDGEEDLDGDGAVTGQSIGGTGSVGVGETDPNVADTDGDGLSDGVEVDGAPPTSAVDQDTDDDGLTDSQEASLGTNPTIADTDGDGLSDGLELGFADDADPASTTDPLNPDSDGDGLSDGSEDANGDGAVSDQSIGGTGTAGAGETDPQLADTDGDGLSDGAELGSNPATSPVDSDTDDDGLTDSQEASFGTNPTIADTDGDGLSDGLELGFADDADPASTTDPLNPDSDGDGLSDGSEDANGDGAVSDQSIGGTGTGGAGETDPLSPDTDGDGLTDSQEAGFGTNPTSADTDGDGLEDGLELGLVGDADPSTTTDPLDDDSDDDGLVDGTEDANGDGAVSNQVIGGTGTSGSGETDPNAADTDGDGVQDGTEVGLTGPEGTDTGDGFVPDSEPGTTTSPVDTDSDDGGILDGVEDGDTNGGAGGGETDATLGGDDCPEGFEPATDGLSCVTLDADGDGILDTDEAVYGTDPLLADTDGDGLDDGLELALVGDADPSTTSDPLDADSDDDGVLDGAEDADHDGASVGETDPNAADTDGDGIQDGTELGLTAPQGAGTDLEIFVADADPSTTTDPLDTDSDDGGILDGVEDPDGDGQVGDGETDPTVGSDDCPAGLVASADGLSCADTDSDGDGLSDAEEIGLGTDPAVADSDGDGLPDGLEVGKGADADPSTTSDPLDADSDDDGVLDGAEDADQDGASVGETDPNAADTDGDGIQDGTELGLAAPQGAGTDLEIFVADADPSTTTDPLDTDSDGGGILDGVEDPDGDGQVGDGETDPTVGSDDCPAGFTAASDGLACLELDGDGDGLGDATELGIGTDPTVADTDGDGLKDGEEVDDLGTDPLDADTDDDGLGDGDEVSGSGQLDGWGATDPLAADTDGDGLNDGLEVGVTEPVPGGTSDGGVAFGGTDDEWVPDDDPSTTTDPLDADTDDDGLSDGTESFGTGPLDGWGPTDPNDADTDDDGLDDGVEVGVTEPVAGGASPGGVAYAGTDADWSGDDDPATTTDPTDADSDDDGLSDGTEVAGSGPLQEFGPTDPNDADTDDDGLNDGLEVGVEEGVPSGTSEDGLEYAGTDGDDTFTPDADPETQTDPTEADTDGDGTDDGVEDANQDGGVTEDPSADPETDPNVPHEDPPTDDPGDTPGDPGVEPGDDPGDDPGVEPTPDPEPVDPVEDPQEDDPAPDVDADGIPDGIDNCPFVANADQADLDEDGVGGLCDYDDGNEQVDTSVGGLALRGSGCTATGDGSGTTGSVVLALLALLLLIGRRRRFVAKAGASCAVLAMALTVASPAKAQEGVLAIEQFGHLPSGTAALNQSYSRTLGHLGWTVALGTLYAHRPLRLVPVSSDDSRAEGSVVPGQIRFEVLAAIGLLDWMQLEIGLPSVVGVGSNDYGVAGRSTDQLTGFAMGDMRFGVGLDIKAMLPASAQKALAGFGFGFRLSMWVPTGDDASFNGEGTVRVEPALVLDYSLPGKWRIGTNLSWHARPESQVFNVVNDDAFRWGVFARGEIGVEGLEAMASLYGSVQIADQVDPTDPGSSIRDGSYDPMELLLGLSYTMGNGFGAMIAAGPGLNDAVGAPEFRALAQLSFSASTPQDTDGDGIIDERDGCVTDPEDPDQFQDDDGCPDPDNDQDGIVDHKDKCPNQAEDRDGYKDEDGCPDVDHDGDGLAEAVDRCPLVPEDRDGFEDDDGCPELDNDRDGIADAADACPLKPEDRDGFEDADGCPDVDNDQDGVVDPKDKCPNDPKDRCRAVKRGGQIVIHERVRFASGRAKLRRSSHPLLTAVAAILRKHPDAKNIEVAGHTDSDGPARRNLKLSQARAEAVVAYLVSRGVPRTRLTARGYGETKPVVPNKGRANKQKNRRVQFVIRATTPLRP